MNAQINSKKPQGVNIVLYIGTDLAIFCFNSNRIEISDILYVWSSNPLLYFWKKLFWIKIKFQNLNLLNLADGEIAGLVIGLFCAFLIVVAVITFLIILYRRKKQAREKSNEK